MKTLYLNLYFFLLSTFGLAQIEDTCEYIATNNYIGGLDCAVGSLINPNFDVTYQWLNCSDNYSIIAGQTESWYSGMTSIYVSLLISYQNCIDTSECYYACTASIDQLVPKKAELIRIVDFMGRDSDEKSSTPLIYIFSDGIHRKMFRVE